MKSFVILGFGVRIGVFEDSGVRGFVVLGIRGEFCVFFDDSG